MGGSGGIVGDLGITLSVMGVGSEQQQYYIRLLEASRR